MKLKFGIILKNMKKRIIIIACLLVLFLAPVCSQNNTQSQNTKIWEHPATEVNTEIEGYFRVLLEITRVEFAKEETRIMMRVSLRPEEWVKFTSDTYLLADGKRYALKSCDGMELDKEVHLTDHNQANLVFHFEPLPKKTKRFDFIEGDGPGAFRILGIESAATRAEQLFPSNWRNTQTGEWEIGFYEDFAIYDCRFWNYKEKQQKGDKYTIVLENEGREITVNVEKNENGKRAISINGTKGEYNIITSITLPDYPKKDTRTSFKDTQYQTDTVTFVGWLKDMPEGMKKDDDFYKTTFSNVFESYYHDLVTISCKTDSLGRFVIKIPLLNSTEVFFDWGRTYIHTLFEPGESYFLLYDFKRGQKLFMGKDCRLQNEILAYPIGWLPSNFDRDIDKDAAMKLLKNLKNEKELLMRELGKVEKMHPTISQRYINYLTGHYNLGEGFQLMQARYGMKDRSCPKEYLDYVTRQHWSKLSQPYTLYNNFRNFVMDFTSEQILQKHGTNRAFSSSEPLEAVNQTLAIVDSLGGDKILRDIITTMLLSQTMDLFHRRFDETTLQFLEENVSIPYAKELIKAKQEMYPKNEYPMFHSINPRVEIKSTTAPALPHKWIIGVIAAVVALGGIFLLLWWKKLKGSEAIHQKDSQKNEQLQQTVAVLEEELETYRKEKDTHSQMRDLNALQQQPEVKRILEMGHERKEYPSYDDWHALYPLMENFCPKLVEIRKVTTETEYQVCVLTKLNCDLSDIGYLTGLSKSYMSTMRKRLLEKVFHTNEGGAKMFDQRIKEL